MVKVNNSSVEFEAITQPLRGKSEAILDPSNRQVGFGKQFAGGGGGGYGLMVPSLGFRASRGREFLL